MANDRIEQYLEAILEKLNGGTETGVPVPAWRIEQYLAAIYDKCGGSSLPSVTSVDEGKVLTVDNSGAWVAQTPASSGGVLVVTATEGTLDKTWQEIHDAGFSVLLMEGNYMLLKEIGYGVHDGWYVKYWTYDEVEYYMIEFATFDSASGYPTYVGD